MNSNVTMPQLSETMTEGKLLQWNVRIGDTLRAGDTIAEVEADKANMEIEALEDGTVVELCRAPGDMVPVGGVLAVVRQESAGSAPEPEQVVPASVAMGISPLVRRIASQKNVSLDQVKGTGPGGQILVEDVEAYAAVQENVVKQ